MHIAMTLGLVTIFYKAYTQNRVDMAGKMLVIMLGMLDKRPAGGRGLLGVAIAAGCCSVAAAAIGRMGAEGCRTPPLVLVLLLLFVLVLFCLSGNSEGMSEGRFRLRVKLKLSANLGTDELPPPPPPPPYLL